MKKDHRSYRRNSCDLSDTGAAPYLLSLQAKWEQVVELVRCKLVTKDGDDVMKIWKSYMRNAGWRITYNV